MRLVFLFLLILYASVIQGQSVSVFPDRFGTFLNSRGFLDPSFSSKDYVASANSAYQLRTGPFRKIYSFFFIAERNFKNENTNHTARINFYNRKTGPYINSPSAMANYAFRLPLFRDVDISAGFAAGFVGNYYSAPTASSFNRGTFPDASLGLSAYIKNLYMGVSYNRIFSPSDTIDPDRGPFLSFYHFTGSWERALLPYWNIRVGFWYSRYPLVKDELDISAMLLYNKVFEFGGYINLNGKFGGSVSASTGVAGGILKTGIGYNSVGFDNRAFEANSIELFLIFMIK